MSYLVLARKYRPQLFDDVVGQSHVTTTLTHAISAERVAHAILFSGPRGTGKTSVARILAKAMNCSGRRETGSPHPCNSCRSCREITQGSSADVFEIDGASNNSVEQVRELRSNVSYMPVYSPFKIYIIDEVHMLSTAAFNALLKTLEEPPPHVLFMFATTEVHKIPVTILSRCQRHDMRRVSHRDLKAHLQKLSSLENVSVPDESLDLITVEAGGSVRDSLSILDQVIGSAVDGAVTHESVLTTLGAVETSDVMALTEALIRRDGGAVLSAVNRFYIQGNDLRRLFSSLTQTLRNLLVLEVAGPEVLDLPDGEMAAMGAMAQSSTRGFLTKALEVLLAEESAVRYAAAPKMALELALIKILQVPDALSIDTLIRKIDTLQKNGGGPPAPSGPSGPSGGGVSETRTAYAPAPPAAPSAESAPVTPEPAAPVPNQPPLSGSAPAMPQQACRNVAPQAPQPEPQHVPQRAPQQDVPQQAPEQSPPKVPEHVPPQASQQAPQQAPQHAPQQPPSPASDHGAAPAPSVAPGPSPAWNPSDSPEKAWGAFLDDLRKNRPSLAPLLAKSALKKVAGKSIEIEITANRFAVGRLKNGKKKELEDEIRAWFGPEMDVTLHTIIAGEETHSGGRHGNDRIVTEAKEHPVIHEAIRVFGGKVDVNIIKEEDHERHG
ncbi:DNA polymerase III subunit gamma/tau [Desulfoluna butyratoxydans]|uniref:DNA polymerase III subunit gamma/tau n=1 Tax=Desulfoluna butyratoxydans TaxID=231438 RepID=A0A4U8YLK8_9BACT|nr:DNA polymerase III subunit gamma/tau [Desulfoluna butyratoxydans]VFQ44314.1 dna polymerase iii subunit gamma/ tau [Desulfoluna butyratoxydans]